MHAQAIECYDYALRLHPDHADALNNLGTALQHLGRFDEAIRCFRQAVQINPRHPDAHNNLGCAFAENGKYTEAADCYEEALRIDAGNKMALWNRGNLRLLQGDLEGGWADAECRADLPGVVSLLFQQPRWDGSALMGKTILVYPEGGLGDTINFLRYLPLVKACGGKVLFGCQQALCALLSGISGIDRIIAVGSPLPSFDVQISLLGLPRIFATTLATIPAEIPYVAADPLLVEMWRKELEKFDGFKVGISWSAGSKKRSIRLAIFERLARVKNVRLISLQKGIATDQIPALGGRFSVLDLGDRLDQKAPFLDTAAVMRNLDLVVSVDTAVTHLAGALGVPVWVPLLFNPDPRWLLNRSDSPWYPTMRLFRQKRIGQ